jgi:hypothetical protein
MCICPPDILRELEIYRNINFAHVPRVKTKKNLTWVLIIPGMVTFEIWVVVGIWATLEVVGKETLLMLVMVFIMGLLGMAIGVEVSMGTTFCKIVGA